MKRKLHLLFGIGLIALFVFVGWKLISIFFTSLSELEASVSAAIIGAMATVFAGTIVVLITQHMTKTREIEDAHREKKVEIYNKFLITIIRILKGSNQNIKSKPISETELIEYMVDFKREILLWGSPKVIKAQLKYEASAGDTKKMFYAVDNIYKAIREDIGLSNKGLMPLDLFKLFLKDPQEIDNFFKNEKLANKKSS